MTEANLWLEANKTEELSDKLSASIESVFIKREEVPEEAEEK